MLYTSAFVVVISAFVMLFSKEIIDLVKKVLAIRGMKLVMPLLLVTGLIIKIEPYILIALLYIQESLLVVVKALAGSMHMGVGGFILADVLLLLGLSVIPVLALEYWKQKTTMYPYKYPYFTSMLIWIFISILLVTS